MSHIMISEIMKRIWAETAGIGNHEQRKQIYSRKLIQSITQKTLLLEQ